MLLVGVEGEGVGGAGTGYDALDPFFECGTGEEDAVLAGEAADSDVGAEAVDLPVAPSTGVRFTHLDYVSE